MKKSYRMDLLAIIAGALTVLAFSPINQWWFACLSPFLLLMTWQNTSPNHAAWRGLLFGIGLYSTGISWVFVSMNTYGNMNALLAGMITFIFVLLLSWPFALQGALLNSLWNKNPLLKTLLAFPASWVIVEWLHDWLFTGFPWLLLGTSQVNGPLAGYAPIVGTLGTSFIVTLMAALLFNARVKTKSRWIYCTVFILFIVLGFGLQQIQWTHPTGKTLEVSLVQGNVPQETKWDPAWIDLNIQRYEALSATLWKPNILIIWPENSLPLSFDDATSVIASLHEQARKHQATLIAGIPMPAARDNYFNSLITLNAAPMQHYFKRHLVPLGEYIPLENWLRPLQGFFDLPMSSFVSGNNQQPLITVNHIPFATFICYEIAYGNLVRTDLPKAEALLVISDDAWFGHSLAGWQQLQIAQMIALSTGRELVSATNNGMTAIVNVHGKIVRTLPPYQEGVLTHSLASYTGTTPWALWGNEPILLLVLSFLIFSYFVKKKFPCL